MDSTLPQSGDVLIHRQVHSPAVYVLSTLDGPPQFFHKTYKDAVDRATRFAFKESVDAWYTTDELIFKRVAQHRPTS
jgi:hypothetical protein